MKQTLNDRNNTLHSFLKWAILLITLVCNQIVYSQRPNNQTLTQYIDSLELVIKTSEKKDTTYVKTLNAISESYQRSNPKQTEIFGKQALEISKDINYRYGEGIANLLIATSFRARGKYSNAIDNLLEALKIFTELNDKRRIASTYIRMALVHDDMGEYEKALGFHFKSLSFIDNPTPAQLGTIHNNIGVAYHNLENLDSAAYFYNKSLANRIQANNNRGISQSYNNLGLINYDNGNYDIALNYYALAVKFKLEIDDYNGLASTYNNIGQVYITQKKYQLAESYLDTALVYGRKSDAIKWVLESLSEYRDLETARGEYKKALDYSNQYHAIKDSMFTIEKSESIALLEEQFQAAEKDKEIALLEAANSNRRLWRNVFGLSLGLVLIVSVVVFYFQKQKLTQNEQLFQAKQALSEKEIENLKLKEKELQHEIYFKNKELASYTINFIQKNELFDDLKKIINSLKKTSDQKIKPALTNMQRLIRSNYNIDKDWEQFKKHFTNVHPDFFQNLKNSHPDLSTVDLRLCALLKMNLTAKESSAILGIGPDSVKTARHRLRKKFDLEREDKLVDYLINIDS